MLLRDNAELIAIIGRPVRPMPTVYAYNKCFEAVGAPFACIGFEASSGPDALAAMRALRFRGMAVTMPFKASVLSEVDRVSETARKVGACNTLYWSGGEIVAENTDAVAVETLLAQASDFQRRAVVIGSGGAARAAVAALGGRGYTVVLLARNATTRQNLAREFSCVETSSSQLEEAFTNPVSLIVNATPVGWLSDVSPLDAQFLKPGIAVMDFVFSKSPTRLLRDAAAVGCRVIDGLTILAIQGVRQIELWTDRFMDERDMRGWLEEAIDV